MTNNDILRRIRYTFDLSDTKMMAIFASAESEVSRSELSSWLKKEDDDDYKSCGDLQLATFLNGFINIRRGKKDGPAPVPENKLNNNIIFTKLKIALNLKAEEVLELLALADFRMSKPELSALFRKPDHKHFRVCKDQIMRNFLHGIQLKYRPEA